MSAQKQKFKSGRKTFTEGEIVLDKEKREWRIMPNYGSPLPYLHLEPLAPTKETGSSQGVPLSRAYQMFFKKPKETPNGN